jgi:REP element-mobilizing transposase RayT
VTTRATYGRVAYRVPFDCMRFLQLVEDICVRYELRCLTYCLMATHYHALLRSTKQDAVQPAMHRLNGIYGRWVNWRYDEHGHVFADRYRLIRANDDAHLLELFRYIALNPVRAGVRDRPEDCRWSGYRALLGLEPAPPWLDVKWPLALFGCVPEIAPPPPTRVRRTRTRAYAVRRAAASASAAAAVVIPSASARWKISRSVSPIRSSACSTSSSDHPSASMPPS